MMAEENAGEFHAKLEHQGGVFRAIYRRPKNADEPLVNYAENGQEPMTDSHIGTDAEAVKGFVEAYAMKRGYTSVVWEE